MNIQDRVAILLCTYNGENYIEAQLDSLIKQTYRNWVIYIHDDGSTDGTIRILEQYKSKLDTKIFIGNGPNKGFAWNFISLLQDKGSNCQYFAFCDQDDIWFPDKLKRSIDYLSRYTKEKLPAIYCGRTKLIDEDGCDIGFSPLFKKQLSFKNALVQSIAGGNTMVLNFFARDLLLKTPRYQAIVSHDWWAYILISGCNGHIYYDSKPALGYRQHAHNVIGSNSSIIKKILRLKKLMKGHFKKWNQMNIELLTNFEKDLSTQNREILELFIQLRQSNLLTRFIIYMRLKFYRQSLSGNIALIIAVLLKKI